MGYRPLSETDIQLMNRIKMKGSELMLLIEEVMVAAQAKGNTLWANEQNAATLVRAAETSGNEENADAARKQLEGIQQDIAAFQRAEPMRWAALGRSDIQQGVMAVVRAVAQPDSLI
jgi:hypothetical protein